MFITTTQPTVEPVSIDEAKLHCRIDVDEDDALIASLIKTARQHCEIFTGRAFVQRTLQLNCKRWPSRNMLFLPRPPLVSVTSVIYYLTDGTPITLAAGTDYLVDTDSEPGAIVLPYGKSWPTNTLYPLNPIRIKYVAGYPATIVAPFDYKVNIPDYLKSAILLCVGNWYEHREAVLPAGHVGKELPMGVQSLLWQERVFWGEELNK